MSPVSVHTYIEVKTFYALQMRLLDALDIEGYAATFTEDGRTPRALVDAADAALYTAKAQGRDRVAVAGPGARETKETAG